MPIYNIRRHQAIQFTFQPLAQQSRVMSPSGLLRKILGPRNQRHQKAGPSGLMGRQGPNEKQTAKGKCWNVAKCKGRSHLEFPGIEALDVCSLVVPGAPCLKLVKGAIQTFLYGTPLVIEHTHAAQCKQRAHPKGHLPCQGWSCARDPVWLGKGCPPQECFVGVMVLHVWKEKADFHWTSSSALHK